MLTAWMWGDCMKELIKNYIDLVDDSDLVFLNQVRTIVKKHIEKHMERKMNQPSEDARE